MASREERVDDLATEDVDTLVEIIIAAEEERDLLLSERQELINAIEDMLDRQLRCRLSKCWADSPPPNKFSGWFAKGEEIGNTKTTV